MVRGKSDDFVLVLAGSRVNHFANVTYDGAALSADFGPDGSGSFRDHVGEGLFRNVTYTPTEVQFRNLLALHGDTDGNRTVDITDFNALASHFDPTGDGDPLNGPFWNEGNFDGDGDTDITDFNLLATNFAPGGYSTSAIPEPSTMLLAALALILVGCLFQVVKEQLIACRPGTLSPSWALIPLRPGLI